MRKVVSHIGNREYTWALNDDGSHACNGNSVDIEMRKVSGSRVSVLKNGFSFDAIISGNKSGYEIYLNGFLYKVDVETSAENSTKKKLKKANLQPAGLEVRSPMPGMVVRLEVNEGAKVEPGDGLLILEAMKMENEIKSRSRGTVARVLVSEKQIVDKGQLLLVIQ